MTADAAGWLPAMVGDQQGSWRAVDGWQVAALALEHGGQLAGPGGYRPPGLGLGGGHVLEDQDGGAGVVLVLGAPE